MSRAPLSLPLLGLLAACAPADDHRAGAVAAETQLIAYATCDDLRADLRDMLLDEVEAHFDQERYFLTHPSPILEDGAGPPRGEPASAPPREEGKDYSGTNNQEAGVDEADFVKTDGYHIYLINGNRVHILGVPELGQVGPESTFAVEGAPAEMLLDKEAAQLAVFSNVPAAQLPPEHPLRARLAEIDSRGTINLRVPSISKITVIDVSDARAPRLVREVWIEGWYQTARLVDHTIRFGAWSYLSVPEVELWFWAYIGGNEQLSIDQREAGAKAAARAAKLDDIVPRFYERLPDRTFRTIDLTEGDCRSFHRPTDSRGRGITSLVTLDLSKQALALDADQIVSNSARFYASTDRMYVFEPANDWWWFWWNEDEDEVTNIHAFDISTAGRTTYVGSGRVTGTVNDSFAMDEEDGILRVATTTDRWNRWWIETTEQVRSESHVVTLEERGGRLDRLGRLDGIAPGERIFSSRFSGDRAYIVTYRNVDPLFVIDLSDPASPRALGHVEVPGVSTYIHELPGERLLTVGWTGDEQGLTWRPQVSLFDVSDEAHPALVDAQPLGAGTAGWSEALYEHKAFQYWDPRHLLAVPVSSVTQRVDAPGYEWSYTSKLELVSVDQGGLSSVGAIDHSSFYNSDPTRLWSWIDIRRSIFMGDYIYAISDRGVSVHALDGLARVAEAPLPGSLAEDAYWWW